MPHLFEPLHAGELHLTNRLMYAPMTRLRATTTGVPTDLMATHFAQRADVGLIVTDGTYPTRAGQKYPQGPGLADEEQARGWAHLITRVHEAGGVISIQLMHAGFSTSPTITDLPVQAASRVGREGYTHDVAGNRIPYPTPEPLPHHEFPTLIDGFVQAARRAMDAGADAVEIHAANGYLLHQFLSPHTNTRDDEWGGSPSNRARLAAEITCAVANEVGAGRVGIRLSPGMSMSGVIEDDPTITFDTYAALAELLAEVPLAYVSLLHTDPTNPTITHLRENAPRGAAIFFNDFSRAQRPPQAAVEDLPARAQRLLDEGWADGVAVGRAIAANPRFAEKLRNREQLNVPRPEFFYTHGAQGYTDYP